MYPPSFFFFWFLGKLGLFNVIFQLEPKPVENPTKKKTLMKKSKNSKLIFFYEYSVRPPYFFLCLLSMLGQVKSYKKKLKGQDFFFVLFFWFKMLSHFPLFCVENPTRNDKVVTFYCFFQKCSRKVVQTLSKMETF